MDVATGAPWWIQAVYAAVAALVAVFLVPYLKRKADAAKAEASKADLDTKEAFLGSVKAMLLDEAGNIAEQRFPILAEIVKNKKLAASDVKDELRMWGKDLRERARDFFAHQGVDLIAKIGDNRLDSLIRSAADRVSPFPGKDTAVTLLTERWSNKIVERGIDWVRDRFLEDDDEDEDEGEGPPS